MQLGLLPNSALLLPNGDEMFGKSLKLVTTKNVSFLAQMILLTVEVCFGVNSADGSVHLSMVRTTRMLC